MKAGPCVLWASLGCKHAHVVEGMTASNSSALGILPPYAHVNAILDGTSFLIMRSPDLASRGTTCSLLPRSSTRCGSGARAREHCHCGLNALEIARVEAGRPEWGLEIDRGDDPQEANFDELQAISYTKGCLHRPGSGRASPLPGAREQASERPPRALAPKRHPAGPSSSPPTARRWATFGPLSRRRGSVASRSAWCAVRSSRYHAHGAAGQRGQRNPSRRAEPAVPGGVMRALVTGATGYGGPPHRRAAARGRMGGRRWVRDASRAAELTERGAEAVVGM